MLIRSTESSDTEARAFVDSLVDPLKSSHLEVRRSIYSKLFRELAGQQCYMLTNPASELQRQMPRRRALVETCSMSRH